MVVVNRGLERLREAGFTQAEIQRFRDTFHSQHASEMNEEQEQDEEEEERMTRLEEAWLEGIHTEHDDVFVDGMRIGVYQDMFLGMMIGFFGGMLSVLWLVAWSWNSKWNKIGISAGLFVNLTLGSLRWINVGAS